MYVRHAFFFLASTRSPHCLRAPAVAALSLKSNTVVWGARFTATKFNPSLTCDPRLEEEVEVWHQWPSADCNVRQDQWGGEGLNDQ